MLLPVVGRLVAGLLIRYGSPKIAGHGLPEAMEAVLTEKGPVAPKVGFLKAVASSVTIRFGQPFGVEGPILQTGGAFGSWLGHLLTVTASERRILLAAGAAAGMAAIFGTPISAVLLIGELLLFEFRVRSITPVAIASAVGAGMHYLLISPQPLFPTPAYDAEARDAFLLFAALGAACGLLAVLITRCSPHRNARSAGSPWASRGSRLWGASRSVWSASSSPTSSGWATMSSTAC